MGLGLSLGHRQILDTRYRLTRAVDCDLTALVSAMDFYAPHDERQGNWIHNPIPPDPVEAYKACYEAIMAIDPNSRLSLAQLVRKSLSTREENPRIKDSAKFIELMKKVGKYFSEVPNDTTQE